jgi:hypothetical protein
MLKVALDLMKKGIRHPSTKTKPSNIITPTNYEQHELQQLAEEIKDLEGRYREMKRREQAEELKLKDDGGGWYVQPCASYYPGAAHSFVIRMALLLRAHMREHVEHCIFCMYSLAWCQFCPSYSCFCIR